MSAVGELPSVALYFHRLTGPGGAERMVCNLANVLCAAGHPVLIVSWDDVDIPTFYPLLPAVLHRRLPIRGGVANKISRTRRLAAALREVRAEVLIGFVMSGDKTVYVAALLAGVRMIAAERNASAIYRLRYSALQRFQYFMLLRLVDSIVVQQPEFVDGYPAGLRDRMSVIANPVFIPRTMATPGVPDAEGHFTLLCISRLDNVQKGLDVLIHAFASLVQRRPEWRLRIVGDGEDGRALHEQIAREGMEERIVIDPARSDVEAVLSGAHLFVIPSRWEGFPNALAEAAAIGLPAVGFAGAAGVRELIEDGESGWLAHGNGDVEDLAAAMEAAMNSPEERVRRGMNAREAMRVYTPERHDAAWRELIGRVSGKATSSGVQ